MTEIKTHAANFWDDAARLHTSRVFESAENVLVFNPIVELRHIIDVIIEQVFTESKEISDLYTWYNIALIAVNSGYVKSSVEELVEILTTKHSDYGPYNIARFGQRGIIIRLNDKISRLEHLASISRDAANESICDTYLDIVGYSVIGAMLLDSTFFLGLNED